MKITNLYNVEAIQGPIDIFIGAWGRESRSLYWVKQLPTNIEIRSKYILRYAKHVESDALDSEVQVVDIKDEDNSDPITSIVRNHLSQADESLTILIDYSSMSRMLYARFLKYCSLNNLGVKIDIIFAYNIAEPIEPPKEQRYKFGPMAEYIHLSIPNKPTALIIGLGYEQKRAYSLKEYFDAEAVYIFRTDKYSAPGYYELVDKHNKQLLSNLDSDHIFEYSIKNISYANKLLTDLCDTLSKDYRIVIAPCGPKPFTLICLLTALRFDTVDIWRINNEGNVVNKQPTDQMVYTGVTFHGEG